MMLAGPRRRISCEQISEHLGCHMVAVGSRMTTWRQRAGYGEEKARARRGEASALCPSVATAPSRYSVAERPVLSAGGASEADLRRDGEQQRGRRRNRPAAAEFCSGARWENGGRGRERNFRPL